jgi:periplasmic protein TonB
MLPRQEVMPYTKSIRSLTLWTTAFILSLALNAMFLTILPELINKNPSKPKMIDDVSSFDVIRMKRQETPPRKKEIKKLEKEKKLEKKTLEPRLIHKKPEKIEPKLPFELNPRLPVGPGTLPTFPLQSAAIDFNGLKNVYGVGDLDGPLTPLAKIPPIYPINARRRGIEGWVKVQFIVTHKGVVDQIEIIEATPPDIFDQSVIHCVSSWRFKPGTIQGEPVDTWVNTTIRFNLN